MTEDWRAILREGAKTEGRSVGYAMGPVLLAARMEQYASKSLEKKR